MKQGQSFDDVIETINRQAALEYDMIVPTQAMRFIPRTGGLRLALPDHPEFGANDVFMGQAQEQTGIPKRYFDSMMAEDLQDLAAVNLNAWLTKQAEPRLVRTHWNRGDSGTARALLSPSYDRTWGHKPMVEGLMQAADFLKDMEFISCKVTDRRLYLKAVIPDLVGTIEKKDARVGDAFRAGFLMRNSEVGEGRGELMPFIDVFSCSNGMTFTDLGGISKVHRGKRQLDTGELRVVYSSATTQAKRLALAGEIRDVLAIICSMDTVRQIQDSINRVATVDLENPLGAIQVLGSSYGLTQAETKTVEEKFLRGGDVTRWGLVQALTASAEASDTYDRASELEALGSKIVTLSQDQWKVLDKAA